MGVAGDEVEDGQQAKTLASEVLRGTWHQKLEMILRLLMAHSRAFAANWSAMSSIQAPWFALGCIIFEYLGTLR